MPAKKKYENITTKELPDILTAQHISAHIHLSLNRVYELFRLSVSAGGIKSFPLGRAIRVKKEDYLEWLLSKINQPHAG